MGESNGNARRTLQRVVAGIAVSDVVYRLFMREALRRALGVEVRRA